MIFQEAYNIYLSMWREPHRFYHNETHLFDLMGKIGGDNIPGLYWALFHDIIYNPKSSTNEEDSAAFFKQESINFDDLNSEQVDFVVEAILATKDHNAAYKPDIAYLIRLDVDILFSDFDKLIEYENKIFKEYQFVPVEDYRKGRLAFLEKYKTIGHIKELIDYVKTKKYNIGIYAGSFNPFHIGHLDVLRKAERIFDKVIVVQGINPDKDLPKHPLPASLPNEKIVHSGLITELFTPNNGYTLTMVRGVRNEYDIAAEMNYQAWVNELTPGINFIHIFCEPENVKISSSSIRGMSKFNGFNADKYIVR